MGNSIYYCGNLKKCKSLREKVSTKHFFFNLHRTNERLAEVSTELLLQKQQNRSLLSVPNTRPVLETPGVGNFNNSFVLYGHSLPRENLVIPTSRPRISNNSIETYLIKVCYIIFFPLGFRFLHNSCI